MVTPFARNSVRLLPGPIHDRQALAGRYLLELDADRLLHNFRVNAGLPSTAKPLGGWESPECGLRGHFVGHYLSACSQMYAATGDERFKRRVELLVAELEKCQIALGGGYLSAFPETEFDTLEEKFGGVWAPYYTLHKILAGLLDAARDGECVKAGEMAIRLGDWIAQRLERVPVDRLEPMLRTDQLNPSNEYGGIGEALYDLFALYGNNRHLKAAQVFDRAWFLRPLMAGQDELAGLHANTHIPQVLAAAKRYELTGDERYRKAVEYFWERTALARSYVNGGSSGPRPDRRERSEGGEHWPHANCLNGTLTPKINESCVVHNMVRLTDVLFCWSQETRFADFRERAWLNSVLAVQHPAHPGGFIYSHPLAAASRKVYGDFDDTFWCCYGTSVEAFARLADGVYIHDEQMLWVSQFVASEVNWIDKHVRLIQQTGFPYEPGTHLTVHCDTPVNFAMKIRVPGWANGAICRVNDQDHGDKIAPGSFATISRTWRDGDRVDLTLPMQVSAENLPGDAHMVAFLYGPTVLAARTPHGTELGVPASAAAKLVQMVDSAKLLFQIRLVSGTMVRLIPLNEIVDEAYGVYFRTS
jgi:DUF1680 family protein